MSTFSTAPPSDDVQVRCPRLGHQVHFGYCMVENMDRPCFKALDCWHHRFDVVGYFKQTLSGEDFAAAFAQQGRPKMQTLVDLIQQAQKNTTQDPSRSDKGPA